MARPVLPPRPIRVEGEIAYVPLTRGFEATIDVQDVPLIHKYNWCVKTKTNGTVYAQRTVHGSVDGKRHAILLHRVLLGVPDEMQVDHRDGSGLNCRRNNLRQATHTQNTQNAQKRTDNTSGFKGVHWQSRKKRWVARIQAEGKRKYLGYFKTPEAAHAAYAQASAALHKEFGRVA